MSVNSELDRKRK